MPTKLIENRINESGITDFFKGFGSGLKNATLQKLGVDDVNNKMYKQTMAWFKQKKLEVSNLPGVKAYVLSANLGGQRLDIIMNQNDSGKIYIKFQGIVCPFSLLSDIYGSWQDSDTQRLFEYANMMDFYRKEGEDKEYKGDSKKKYKLINTDSQYFYVLYGVVKDFNIPLLNPNKMGINPSEYNTLMLTEDDVTDNKKCKEFLVKYMFALIYITYNTPDKLIDFANGIGANTDQQIEKILKDDKGALQDLINRGETDTEAPGYEKKVEKHPMKLAVKSIVQQIFET